MERQNDRIGFAGKKNFFLRHSFVVLSFLLGNRDDIDGDDVKFLEDRCRLGELSFPSIDND